MNYRTIFSGLKLSLSYYTVVPVYFGKDEDINSNKASGWMIAWLPLVGALLSLAVIGINTLFNSLGILGAVAAALAYPVLYGFLHTEAVIDVVDAIYARHGGKDPYEVIKQPDVGAIGVLWGVWVFMAKLFAMIYLLWYGFYGVIIGTMIVSRILPVILIYRFDFRSTYARKLQSGLSVNIVWGVALFWSLVVVWLNGWSGLCLVFAGLMGGYIIAISLRNKLGFANGDLLGASLELNEVMLLFIGSFVSSISG